MNLTLNFNKQRWKLASRKMGSESNKRYKRAANFLPNEEDLLLKLVNKYRDVIDNKKTDTFTSRQKQDAWAHLTEDYNSSDCFYREEKTLRLKYENIKKNSRKRIALSSCTDLSPDEISGMSYNDSGDSLDLNNIKVEIPQISDESVCSLPDPLSDVTSLEMRCEESRKLTNSEKSPKKNIDTKIPEEKLMFTQLKAKLLQEEHDLKINQTILEHKTHMKQMEEEHVAKMKLYELEIKIKQKELGQTVPGHIRAPVNQGSMSNVRRKRSRTAW